MKLFKVGILLAIAAAVLVLAVYSAHVSPAEAATKLVQGSLGNASKLSLTLKETSALLLAGLAVFFALRAGLFNIGVEGQFVIGAMASTAVALRCPNGLGVLLALLAGLLAGGIWALPAGLIKAYRGGHEVITTIMLNNVAGFLVAGMLSGPLRDPARKSMTTANLPEGVRLQPLSLGDLRVSPALIVALVLVGFLWFWLKRTVSGYELQAVGAGSSAASVAGISSKRVTVWAMAGSGAIGGLAGALHVLAFEGRFYENFSPGYGFDGLGVALLAGSSAVALIPAALGFGILNKGTASLQLLSIPKGISNVVLGLLIVVFAAIRYRRAQEVET